MFVAFRPICVVCRQCVVWAILCLSSWIHDSFPQPLVFIGLKKKKDYGDFFISKGRLRHSGTILWVRILFLDALTSIIFFMAATNISFTIQNAKVKQSRSVKVLEHYNTPLCTCICMEKTKKDIFLLWEKRDIINIRWPALLPLRLLAERWFKTHCMRHMTECKSVII